MKRHYTVEGAGLGLRRELLESLVGGAGTDIDFYELVPENWINFGGQLGKQLRSLTERFPFVSHGLSLSIGSPAPLDEVFLQDLKKFLDAHQIRKYTEHLSYCSDDGHLYDLMPIPFTLEAAEYVAGRICRVQEILERRIAIENVSYYAAPGKELEEIEFLNAVVEQADCELLLDINNIYVNSVNHGYDPSAFLAAIPADRVAYAHIAGHYVEAEDLIVDSHGAEVIDPVWGLLEQAYQLYGTFPTLLERDFNIPPLPDLLDEVRTIRSIQRKTRAGQDVSYG
ncbi:MAG: hypothetical protein DSY87_09375 [Methylococcus sp.]|nr:MAG: hypothetical protein DSY87_09375 [Methylococcus sp.]